MSVNQAVRAYDERWVPKWVVRIRWYSVCLRLFSEFPASCIPCAGMYNLDVFCVTIRSGHPVACVEDQSHAWISTVMIQSPKCMNGRRDNHNANNTWSQRYTISHVVEQHHNCMSGTDIHTTEQPKKSTGSSTYEYKRA